MDNKLKIINYLGKSMGQQFTMHSLSKAIKVPYATFYRTVQEMGGLIKVQAVGKAKAITLNRDSPVIKSYLAISSEEEKREFLKRQPIISKIASELKTEDTVVLFGSYAKGTERESSDIDLLIINKKGNRSISFSKHELIFKKKINPIFVTRKEFIAMLRSSEENLGKQALKAHIILQNPESFWEDALSG